jgi:hypothetical protein
MLACNGSPQLTAQIFFSMEFETGPQNPYVAQGSRDMLSFNDH